MRLHALALATLALTSVAANSADWPTAKPVRIIAPSTPGGGADLFGRLLADNLPTFVGGKFIVENRAGAGGLIGTAATAHAEPDGYTFGVAGIAYQVIAPAVSANPGFDPMKDMTHIAYIGGPPNVFVVNPALGVRSLKDLVEVGRRGEAIPYVSPGVGTLGHLLMEYFAQKTGIKVQQIMTSGAPQGMMDLVAGNVNLGTMTWTTALGQIRAGKVIPIAVTASARLKEAPDLPTFKEQGYADLTTTSWFAFSGPARIPGEITQKLNQAVIKMLDLPAVRERMTRDAIETKAMTPQEYTAFVQSEIDKWGPLARRIIARK